VSVLEAMAEGVPTVLSSGCVFSREIGEAGGAIVVEPTVEGVAQGIGTLLADPVARAALGRRGREVIRERFSISAVVDRLEQVYFDSVRLQRAKAELDARK
jgi:glycosyltransferase involved in cell wall biosynthesis